MVQRVVIVLAVLLNGTAAQARDDAAAAQASGYATLHCIGIEWPIDGDANHDATCRVAYRPAGSGAWREALPLLRVDTDRAHGFAGSIFGLEPDTAYEVRLAMTDPDGGQASTTLHVRTRPEPAMPANGRRFHVVPGSGGGDGSAASPFRGIAAAERVAQPGDTFLLHRGDYGVVELTRAGSPGGHIVWQAAEDGDAIIRGLAARPWVWLDGLTFATDARSPILQNERYQRHGHKTGLTTLERGADNVCVTRSTFHGFHYSIELGRGCREWYIADNVIVGDNDPITGGLGGEGVELNKTSGNIVAYNRISRVADAVSYPGSDCDIYGNDIFDVSDDAVETDMGQQNNRVWGNRITNAHNAVFSFQPMNRGPWYFVRNQVIMTRGIIWKFVVVNDRFVALHNTFVFPNMASQYAQRIMNSFSRNNLYIAYGERPPLWRGAQHPRNPDRPGGSFSPTWMADVDYNGFDWSDMSEPFHWDGRTYPDLASFAAAVGIEQNAMRVDKEQIFANWATPVAQINAPRVHLTLAPGSAAVDAGQVLANINEDYAGEGPDLGALELGKPLPHYGPRPGGVDEPQTDGASR